MRISSKKTKIGMAAAVIAGSLALAVLFSYQGQAKQVEAVVQNQPSDQGDGIGFQFSEPEAYVNETGKSAVRAEVASEAVSIKRGGSANIEVVAKHLGGANADQSITVKVLPPIGYILYPPSVAKITTPEQRYEAARSATVLAGGIDLGKFMSIVGADQKAVAKNSQQVYSVMISVPKDLPDELLGEIFIPINIEVMDVNGNEVPGLSTGITIEVST